MDVWGACEGPGFLGDARVDCGMCGAYVNCGARVDCGARVAKKSLGFA